MIKVFIDQLGNRVEINGEISRIVSTVPSQTELLYFFGMDEKIVGITDYCVHPKEKVNKVPKIGGPKTLDINKIKELQPDLIIASKEENSKNQIEELSNDFPVWVSDVKSMEDAFKMIEKIGMISDQTDLAQNIVSNLDKSLDLLHSKPLIKVAYLIWENPLMAVGNNTYINDVLKRIGFINVFSDKVRYPKITNKELLDSKADFIFLSSEPYPFNSQHIDKFKQLSEKSTILLVNGQYFSWYGNRLLLAINYFKTIKSMAEAIIKN